MKFEIDDETGIIETDGDEFDKYWPAECKDLETILQAVKKTEEKIGRQPNYEKSDEYEEVPVIVYDGVNGFMVEDVRLIKEPLCTPPRLRVPTPEEKEKFLQHAKLVSAKLFNKQIQEIQDSKNTLLKVDEKTGALITAAGYDLKNIEQNQEDARLYGALKQIIITNLIIPHNLTAEPDDEYAIDYLSRLKTAQMIASEFKKLTDKEIKVR